MSLPQLLSGVPVVARVFGWRTINWLSAIVLVSLARPFVEKQQLTDFSYCEADGLQVLVRSRRPWLENPSTIDG